MTHLSSYRARRRAVSELVHQHREDEQRAGERLQREPEEARRQRGEQQRDPDVDVQNRTHVHVDAHDGEQLGRARVPRLVRLRIVGTRGDGMADRGKRFCALARRARGVGALEWVNWDDIVGGARAAGGHRESVARR